MDDPEVSGLINARDFSEFFSKISNENNSAISTLTSQDEYIKKKMGISDDMLEELHSVAGKETLNCEGELSDVAKFLKNIPDDTPLVTLAVHKDTMEKRMKREYNNINKKEMRYRKNEGPYKHALLANQPAAPELIVQDTEMLFAVRLYRRFNQRATRLIVLQEFNVLGSQTLTDLRDVINCASDNVSLGEFSETPDLPPEIVAKDLYKSAFFYIEGVFYNDMRDPNARDYSKTIMDWAKDPQRGIGPFASFVMDTVSFMDLNVRMGQPYVFVHQGNCEHLVVFSDIRMLHKHECHDRTKYPMVVSDSPEKKNKCRACLMNTAKWVTTESTRSPEDPCFFCETCFKSFNYDIHGNKIGSFKAYKV